jgi:uncharacterized protein YqeY
MALKQRIETEIKSAMIAKDKVRLTALRAIKSLILLEETKAAKQRKDSAEIYEKQNRADLLEVELAELAVIQEFLPKALSEAELIQAIQTIIDTCGASGPKDMGKVMGLASKELAGKADGKAIAEQVKALLSK